MEGVITWHAHELLGIYMDTVGVVDPCQDQLGGRTTEFISNGASIVENGCDESKIQYSGEKEK